MSFFLLLRLYVLEHISWIEMSTDKKSDFKIHVAVWRHNRLKTCLRAEY